MALKTVPLSDRLSCALGPFFWLSGRAVGGGVGGVVVCVYIKSSTWSNSFFLFFIFWAGTQGFKKISKVAGGEISIFSISTLSWNLFNFIFSLCFLSEINTLSVSVDHGRSI